LVKLGIPSGVRPALLQVASSFLLRVAAASGLGCCNCTDGSEVLIRRAVAVAVARAAADSKAAHVTAWVSGVWCCVIAGAIGVVTHALHGCTTRRSCRVRALHRSVRRLLRSRALRGSLHTITLARRTYGVLLRRQRLRSLGSAVHLSLSITHISTLVESSIDVPVRMDIGPDLQYVSPIALAQTV